MLEFNAPALTGFENGAISVGRTIICVAIITIEVRPFIARYQCIVFLSILQYKGIQTST